MMSVTRPRKTDASACEELRLVVVADERQPALEDAPLLDVGDLGREVVALDAVRVVQEVQGVVDRQAEPGPPRDEPLVDLGRDPDLGDLLEDLRARRSAARRASCPPATPSMTCRLRSSVKTSESKRGLVMTSVRRSSTLSSVPGSATAFARWRISSLNRNFSSWSSMRPMVAACRSARSGSDRAAAGAARLDRRGGETTATYGYRPRIAVASATRWTASR